MIRKHVNMLKGLLALMLIAMPCLLPAQSTTIKRAKPKPKTEKKVEQKKKQGKRSDVMQQRRRQEEAEQRRREEQQAENAEKERRRQEEAEQRRREEQQAENAEKERRRQEEAERQRIINNLVSNMVYVQGGTFTMGGKDADAKPAHKVTLSSYSIGKYEVTQREWQAVMGSNPSYFKGDNHPVECVSWDDCQAFISKLNQLTGRNFRLPTEAEWEYAARGGSRSKGYKYAGSNNIDAVAWYDGNSEKTTHDVGMKQPNELGLYDMSGNVCEWCSDWYDRYSSSPLTNPRGVYSGSNRMCRGGCWHSYAGLCRVSSRNGDTPGYRLIHLGLRLVL